MYPFRLFYRDFTFYNIGHNYYYIGHAYIHVIVALHIDTSINLIFNVYNVNYLPHSLKTYLIHNIIYLSILSANAQIKHVFLIKYYNITF